MWLRTSIVIGNMSFLFTNFCIALFFNFSLTNGQHNSTRLTKFIRQCVQSKFYFSLIIPMDTHQIMQNCSVVTNKYLSFSKESQ